MEQRIFPAITSELENVLAMLEGECEKLEVPMSMQMQLSIAVEELFVNVANYAYGVVENTTDSIIPVSQSNEDNTCTVSVYKDGESIAIKLEDYGVPFDPFKKTDPDVTKGAEERDIGGLGIFLVKKNMDSCEYERDGNKNVVTIKKKLN